MAFINDNTIGEIPSLDLTQVGGTYSVPATPNTGQIALYFKTDTLPYYKTPAGTEVLIASGGGSGSAVFSDTAFKLQDDGDVARQMQFQLSGITTGNTRVLTIPDFNGTLATLAGTETFTNKLARFQAGATGANTAPIKLASGALNTSPEIGAVEFLTDKLSLVITTGTARKELALIDPVAGLTSGRVAYVTTNGRLTDASTFTFDGTTVVITTADINGGAIDGTAIGASAAAAGYFSALRELIGGFYGIFTHANSADRTYTLPNFNGTFATLDGVEIFTNKTLTSPAINTATIVGGTINNNVIGGTTPVAGTFTALTVTATSGTPVLFEESGAALTIQWDSYFTGAGGTNIITRHARGTKGSESLLAASDTLFKIDARGYNGSAFSTEKASLTFSTIETWSTTANGTQFSVAITQTATTSLFTALNLTSGFGAFYTQDSGTNTHTAYSFNHLTTATPAAGFGTDVFWNGHSSTNTLRNMALIRSSWVVATDASRTTQLELYAIDTASRLALLIGANGSAATLGFFGAGAIVQPANTVAIDTLLVNLGFRASGGVALFDTDVKVGVVGKGIYVKEGTNATSGVATMSLGTVTVSTNKVTATSRIYLCAQGTGVSTGYVKVSARVNGTSFTITGGGTDTDTVAWLIIEPS